VGRSGAGKSTVVNLMLRFYDVTAGRILIDGQDIAQVSQASLRSQIGMVTQDTSLLHRSVRDNIAYGRPEADEAVVRDEATSALDSEVEAAIQACLYRLMEGKTVGAIAHRLSTIAAMDRLIVLDQGRVVEQGDHASLLARDGLYARLWARQSGGFLGDADIPVGPDALSVATPEPDTAPLHPPARDALPPHAAVTDVHGSGR